MELQLITPPLLALFLAIFFVFMIAATLMFRRLFHGNSMEGFIIADRRVPWWLAGPS